MVTLFAEKASRARRLTPEERQASHHLGLRDRSFWKKTARSPSVRSCPYTTRSFAFGPKLGRSTCGIGRSGGRMRSFPVCALSVSLTGAGSSRGSRLKGWGLEHGWAGISSPNASRSDRETPGPLVGPGRRLNLSLSSPVSYFATSTMVSLGLYQVSGPQRWGHRRHLVFTVERADR